jgi:hypothetical protein
MGPRTSGLLRYKMTERVLLAGGPVKRTAAVFLVVAASLVASTPAHGSKPGWPTDQRTAEKQAEKQRKAAAKSFNKQQKLLNKQIKAQQKALKKAQKHPVHAKP